MTAVLAELAEMVWVLITVAAMFLAVRTAVEEFRAGHDVKGSLWATLALLLAAMSETHLR